MECVQTDNGFEFSNRFSWPALGEAATMTLTGAELDILLGGAKVELRLKRNEVTERRTI